MRPSHRVTSTVTSLLVGTALIVGGSVVAAPTAAAATPIVVDGMNLDRGGTAVVNELERTEVAPGLVHVSYERLGTDGWQQIDVLKAELSEDTVKMRYLSPDTIAGSGATVTEMVEDGGAVAGVNLDRFDINNSWAAAGWGIRDGEILKSGNPDAAASVGVTDDGLGALVSLALSGSVRFEDSSTLPITGVNVYAAPADGLSLFNSRWGSYPRASVVGTPADGVEVIVGADGTVRSVNTSVGAGQLAEGEQALVARKNSASGARLAALQVGDSAQISYGVNEENLNIEQAGGAWHRLLADGQPVPFGTGEHFTSLHPRTMIGFSADRRTAYFVVVDGRTALAKGMAFGDLITLMQDLGAHDAVSVDGGGSTQMNVRPVGEAGTVIANSPSDGYERMDGNGMGLVLAQPGSGELQSFAVRPASEDEEATRVFPGFHRTLLGHGYDETLSPVALAPTGWSSSDRSIATVSGGVVAGQRRGSATIRAKRGVAEGVLPIQVLGTPTRLTVDQNVLNLERQGSSAVIEITGHDAQGFTAPVEFADVEVINPSPETFAVTPTDDGRIEIEATGAEGAATIAFRRGDLQVQVAVAVPLEVRLIDDFSDISGWTTAHDRAPVGGIEPGEGHDGSPSIRLNYDFTASTATRGRYAVAPGAVAGGTGGIDIPGRPQKLSVWVKGDGKGSLLRLQVMQANGVRNWIDGPGGAQSLHVTWTGWERIDFLVPSSFAFPLKLERIRALETVAVKQYTGSLEFSKIYAYLPPDGVEAPRVEQVEDPVVVDADATDSAPLRVAVMSDAQFVARDPDSGAVAGARQTLSEIVAEDPDVLVINGDFVDEASEADFDLARRILDEELAEADFPWYYVPGNHEVMGASISNFTAEFGATSHAFDVDGTRFVTLNSATGVLAAEFAQVRELRRQLDLAAQDPRITGVVVMTHMPTDDPLPTNGSQLSDRNEAELVDDWLQEFRAESGKSVAYVSGHVGVFHASSVDGVPYVINGNSGKSPASTPQDGGFTGWTMLGIDPAEGRWASSEDAGAGWLGAEVKTRVGTLTVAAPASALEVGRTADLSPVVVQDETRSVPVDWPTSFRWTGTDGVFIGAPAQAPASAFVALDPSTHRVHALRAGTGSATLEVNDVARTVDLAVTGGELTIAGAGAFGETLTATLGDWAEGGEVAYTWLRDGIAVDGAVDATYTLGADDIGTVVSVRATVTGQDRTPVSVTRSLDAPVAEAQQPAPTATLAGDATVGSTLHAVTGSWREGTALTYAWLRDGQLVPGARSSAYQVTADDLGARLEARVTGHLAGHVPATAATAPTAPVVAPTTQPDPQPVPEVVGSAQPIVSGSPRVGEPLTVDLAGWEPGTSFGYQWLRDGTPVSGATSATYRPTAADLGTRLSVRVLGSLEGRVSVVRTSAATGPVTPGRLAVRKPRIAGKPVVDSILRARADNGSDDAGVIWRWFRGKKAIPGATSARYELRSTDLGKRIRVRVTVAEPGYESVTRWSRATAPVTRR